jgi:hypothetical protein
LDWAAAPHKLMEPVARRWMRDGLKGIPELLARLSRYL